MIESFFTNYSNTINAVAAFGTWGAVLTALWISHKSNAPNINILADIVLHRGPSIKSLDEHNSPSPVKHIIGVHIANVGRVPVKIPESPFLRWQLRGIKSAMLPFPRPGDNSQPYSGLILNVGERESFSYDTDFSSHRSEFAKLYEGIVLLKILSRLKIAHRLFPVLLLLGTSDGKPHKAKLSPSLKKELGI